MEGLNFSIARAFAVPVRSPDTTLSGGEAEDAFNAGKRPAPNLKEKTMNTPICWFELPTTNLDRAVAFYERVLGTTFRRETCGGHPMAIFAYEENMPGGALVAMPQVEPRDNGTLIYLSVDDLDAALTRVVAAGGHVAMPRVALGQAADGKDIGHIALFIDSEGNRVGLHAYC